jgi:hypothetical protein
MKENSEPKTIISSWCSQYLSNLNKKKLVALALGSQISLIDLSSKEEGR